MHVISMVSDAPIGRIPILKILCRRVKFNDTEKVIRYHPFGISIGTDIAFGISVPESTVGSTEIPNFIRYCQLWLTGIARYRPARSLRNPKHQPS